MNEPEDLTEAEVGDSVPQTKNNNGATVLEIVNFSSEIGIY